MAACGCLTRSQNDLSTQHFPRLRSFIVCQARRDVPTPLPQEAPQWGGPLVWAGAGLAGAAILAPGPAEAYETKPWMPRRHYSGLKQARKPPEFEKSQIWGPGPKEEVGPMHDVKSTVQKMSGAVQGAFGGNEGFTIKKTSSAASGNVILQGMSGPTSRYRPVQQSNSVPIWVPVLGVVLIFLVAFWGRIKAFFTGEGKTAGGRWIRDRSLGGKMVFIPDDAPSTKSSTITSALPDAPTGAASAYAGYGAASKAKMGASGRPSWFVYSPPLPVTPTTQQECRKRAKRILKKLENDKLLGGKDYDVLALIQLYQTCREGNVDVSAPSTTTAAKETMVRNAVQGTLVSAGQSLTRTLRPGDFVCGLSRALGVEEQRTIVIVHAAVAAHVRSLLLAAAASSRSGNAERASSDLGKVVSTVQLFPLPASAPQAELVADAVRDKLTLTETEDILKKLAVRAPEYMELFTVMLGFDVSLTLPMLQQAVAGSPGSNSLTVDL